MLPRCFHAVPQISRAFSTVSQPPPSSLFFRRFDPSNSAKSSTPSASPASPFGDDFVSNPDRLFDALAAFRHSVWRGETPLINGYEKIERWRDVWDPKSYHFTCWMPITTPNEAVAWRLIGSHRMQVCHSLSDHPHLGLWANHGRTLPLPIAYTSRTCIAAEYRRLAIAQFLTRAAMEFATQHLQLPGALAVVSLKGMRLVESCGFKALPIYEVPQDFPDVKLQAVEWFPNLANRSSQ
jgi:hypothetical protein